MWLSLVHSVFFPTILVAPLPFRFCFQSPEICNYELLYLSLPLPLLGLFYRTWLVAKDIQYNGMNCRIVDNLNNGKMVHLFSEFRRLSRLLLLFVRIIIETILSRSLSFNTPGRSWFLKYVFNSRVQSQHTSCDVFDSHCWSIKDRRTTTFFEGPYMLHK